MLILYENIKTLRKENGWSQDELAKKMGYTDRRSIAKIESGKVDLSQSKIMEFARVFGVEPGDLMGWEDEPQRKTPDELVKIIEDVYRDRILMESMTPEEQAEIREMIRLLLYLPRSERQFLHDFLKTRGKQT